MAHTLARILARTLVAMTGLLAVYCPAVAEPLTTAQRSLALSLANEQAWPVIDATQEPLGTQPSVNDQTHKLGLQTISIEKDVIKKSRTHQQVRVYQFSYSIPSARVVVVSLANNQVVKQSLIDSVHLPLTVAEHEYALAVLSTTTEAIAWLKADQQRRGRPPFTHMNELSVKASIYKPLNKNHPCFHERCALLSLFDATNTVFAAEPIVNLQDSALNWLKR